MGTEKFRNTTHFEAADRWPGRELKKNAILSAISENN